MRVYHLRIAILIAVAHYLHDLALLLPIIKRLGLMPALTVFLVLLGVIQAYIDDSFVLSYLLCLLQKDQQLLLSWMFLHFLHDTL